MNKQSIFLLLAIWAVFNCSDCQSEGEATEVSPPVASPTLSANVLLLFQQEQSAAAWTSTDSSRVFLKRFSFAVPTNILPGFYQATLSDDQLQLKASLPTPAHDKPSLASDPYLLEGPEIQSLKEQTALEDALKVVIYPNDPGKDGRLEGRFGSPHWLAARYGKLMIYLEELRSEQE
ncbi:MAG: hypothetical protein AAF990_00360 [Bacteroidota bacterium]